MHPHTNLYIRQNGPTQQGVSARGVPVTRCRGDPRTPTLPTASHPGHRPPRRLGRRPGAHPGRVPEGHRGRGGRPGVRRTPHRGRAARLCARPQGEPHVERTGGRLRPGAGRSRHPRLRLLEEARGPAGPPRVTGLGPGAGRAHLRTHPGAAPGAGPRRPRGGTAAPAGHRDQAPHSLGLPGRGTAAPSAQAVRPGHPAGRGTVPGTRHELLRPLPVPRPRRGTHPAHRLPDAVRLPETARRTPPRGGADQPARGCGSYATTPGTSSGCTRRGTGCTCGQ